MPRMMRLLTCACLLSPLACTAFRLTFAVCCPHRNNTGTLALLESQGFESLRGGISTSILSTPRAVIGRLAQLRPAQCFGLFWRAISTTARYREHLHRIRLPYPSSAQAFGCFDCSISTRHPRRRTAPAPSASSALFRQSPARQDIRANVAVFRPSSVAISSWMEPRLTLSKFNLVIPLPEALVLLPFFLPCNQFPQAFSTSCRQ